MAKKLTIDTMFCDLRKVQEGDPGSIRKHRGWTP